jgi:hypothetical protein
MPPEYHAAPLRLLIFSLLAATAGCSRLARTMMITEMKIGALLTPDEVAIELDRELIERLANRVTITTDFIVDAAAREPNGELFDGDFHFAGRTPLVGMPVVVEIINAASWSPATDEIHRAERRGRRIAITGAWRVWPEHGGAVASDGSDSVAAVESPYAHHVFEIHPATRVGNVDLRRSFVPGSRYRPGAARRTLEIFGRVSATITPGPRTVTITSPNGLYNDVHCLLDVLAERPLIVGDGRFVAAAARELDGTLLVPRLRAVFVAGTPPDSVARRLRPGNRIHVWGLPRIDFSEVLRRTRTGTSSGALPYEIVVLGVYDDEDG